MAENYDNIQSDMNNRTRSRSRSPNRISTKINGRRLYLSNLPFELKWKEIKDLFRKSVGDCYVSLYDRHDGRATGSGIVEFRDIEKAQEAVDKMNGTDVAGRKIIVREETDRDKRRHMADTLGGNRPVGGSMRGPGMMGGGHNMGGPPGMGGPGMGGPIPRMGTGLPANLPPGVTPQLLHSLGITEGPITAQVFVANLDYRCTEQKLKEVFSMAGNIDKLEMKTDADGKFRGMAVVSFETPLEALQSISMFNGQTLFDRSMNVKMDRLAREKTPKSTLPEGLKGIGSSLPIRPSGGSNVDMGGDMNIGGMPNMGMGGSTMGMGGANSMSSGSVSGGGMGSDFMMNMNSGGGLNSGGLGSSSNGMGGGSGSGYGMDNMPPAGNDFNKPGIGDLSSFASLAASLQNNPEAFSTLSRMMNNIASQSSGSASADAGMGGGMSGGSGMMGRRSYGGGSSFNDMSQRSSYGGTDLMNRSFGNSEDINSVFVRNLPFTYTWQMLKETFKAAGDVQYAEIKTDADNKSRGFGTVRFMNGSEARQACNLFNKTLVNGREIEVKLNMR